MKIPVTIKYLSENQHKLPQGFKVFLPGFLQIITPIDKEPVGNRFVLEWGDQKDGAIFKGTDLVYVEFDGDCPEFFDPSKLQVAHLICLWEVYESVTNRNTSDPENISFWYKRNIGSSENVLKLMQFIAYHSQKKI